MNAGKDNYDIGSYSYESIPEAITNLQIYQAPLLYFSWTNPEQWTNGQNLTTLDEISIYINDDLVNIYSDCIPGESMFYFDPEIDDGELLRISIVASSDNIDGWTFNSAAFRFRSLMGSIPYPPEDLTAALVDEDVSLEWEHPNSVLPGAAIPQNYRIYRDDIFIAEIDGGQNTYLDEQPALNEATYYVCAFYSEGIESNPSNSVFVQIVGTQPELPNTEIYLTNYPNPFNPSTTISFSFGTEISEDTEISIYNLKGQEVKTFPIYVSTDRTINSVIWNGTDNDNKPVSSGIYFCKLESGNILQTKKILLAK